MELIKKNQYHLMDPNGAEPIVVVFRLFIILSSEFKFISSTENYIRVFPPIVKDLSFIEIQQKWCVFVVKGFKFSLVSENPVAKFLLFSVQPQSDEMCTTLISLRAGNISEARDVHSRSDNVQQIHFWFHGKRVSGFIFHPIRSPNFI